MKLRNGTFSLFSALLIGLALNPALVPARAASGDKARSREVLTSLWKLSDQDFHLELTTLGQNSPVSTFLTPETRIEGECVHCQIALQCAVRELGKRCATCPCGFTNAQCLTGQKSANPGLSALLQGLPYGTQLHIEFNTPEHPEEGVKRLTIDRLGALLPVEGGEHMTIAQIQVVERAVGATHTTLNSAGSRLQLMLKEDWNPAKATRLEKELEKIGCKVLAPSADQPTR